MYEPEGYQDYPPVTFAPRRTLERPLHSLLSLIAWCEAVWMFNNPYRFFPTAVGDPDMLLNAYNALYDLGMIGVSSNGYQLTADGRYYVRQSLDAIRDEQEQLERQFAWEREYRREYSAMVADTY